MTSSRWTAFAPSDSGQTHCSIVAVQLTLQSRSAGAELDAWAERVVSALPAAGLLGFMLERTDRHLRVVSAWSQRSHVAAFERSTAHLEATTALHAHVLPPTVVVWTEVAAALPPDWHEVRRRLDAVTPASHADRRDAATRPTSSTSTAAPPAPGRTTP